MTYTILTIVTSTKNYDNKISDIRRKQQEKEVEIKGDSLSYIPVPLNFHITDSVVHMALGEKHRSRRNKLLKVSSKRQGVF